MEHKYPFAARMIESRYRVKFRVFGGEKFYYSDDFKSPDEVFGFVNKAGASNEVTVVSVEKMYSDGIWRRV